MLKNLPKTNVNVVSPEAVVADVAVVKVNFSIHKDEYNY